MPDSVFAQEVTSTIQQMQASARSHQTKTVPVDGNPILVPYPFPSPEDWRDCWIYFLLTDRFNNPQALPQQRWNKKFDGRQGGTFKGVQQQLAYLQNLGVRALWLSPVLKNTKPDKEGFAYGYAGYNTQDFLNLDERLASDGTRATAERELTGLVDEAHARGMYIIIDIVLNHAARVFDYLRDGQVTREFADFATMYAPLGQEPSIQWIDGSGTTRAEWQDDGLPAVLGPDDAVWPRDLQRRTFFRRRGSKLSDTPDFRGFVPGDFGLLRQLVHEYEASVPGQESIRAQYGARPVLSILVQAFQYLIAKYDIDGFRIDTVKYLRPDLIETFGNAIREFALSVGKANFFTFGEIYDNEDTINRFVGRNSSDVDGFGIDAALDFPLFYKLPSMIKGLGGAPGVEAIRQVFENRKKVEANLISSHGEAGRYFVSFIDNHDQNERFNAPGTPASQVTMALALLFALQGIPCVYYGTEQGLQGAVDDQGAPTLDALEAVREALWGKPGAFDSTNPFYGALQAIVAARAAGAALRYGRMYFREVSRDGIGFGHSWGVGGIVAFSRILADREVVVIANTSTTTPFDGQVLVDFDLSQKPRPMSVVYSNQGTSTVNTVQLKQANVYRLDGGFTNARIAALDVNLAPVEVQILAP